MYNLALSSMSMRTRMVSCSQMPTAMSRWRSETKKRQAVRRRKALRTALWHVAECTALKLNVVERVPLIETALVQFGRGRCHVDLRLPAECVTVLLRTA